MRQRGCIGEGESSGREAGFSAAAAKCAASGRNDDFWLRVWENMQQQKQPQVLRLALSRIAQDDRFIAGVGR